MIHREVIPLGAGPPGTIDNSVHSSVGERVVSVTIGSQDAPARNQSGERCSFSKESQSVSLLWLCHLDPSQLQRGLGHNENTPQSFARKSSRGVIGAGYFGTRV